MNHRQILALVIVVATLVFAASAYTLWVVARRRLERRNEYGVQMFSTARQAFWTLAIEDVFRRSAAVALPASGIAGLAAAMLLAM